MASWEIVVLWITQLVSTLVAVLAGMAFEKGKRAAMQADRVRRMEGGEVEIVVDNLAVEEGREGSTLRQRRVVDARPPRRAW